MPYISAVERARIESEVGNEFALIVQKMNEFGDLGFLIAFLTESYILTTIATENSNLAQSLPRIDAELVGKLGYRQNAELDFFVTKLVDSLQGELGNYNYAITRIIHGFLQKYGMKYNNLNQVVGVVEKVKSEISAALLNFRAYPDSLVKFDNALGLLCCVQMELYRIIATPYENAKMLENGAVSALDEKSQVELKKYGRPVQIWRTNEQQKTQEVPKTSQSSQSGGSISEEMLQGAGPGVSAVRTTETVSH